MKKTCLRILSALLTAVLLLTAAPMVCFSLLSNAVPFPKRTIDALSSEQIVDIYLRNADEWVIHYDTYPMNGIRYFFLDLDFDGTPELIANANNGSGCYSSNSFYRIDPYSGSVQPMEILGPAGETADCPFDFYTNSTLLLRNKEDGHYEYFCMDYTRISAASGTECYGSLAPRGNVITYALLFETQLPYGTCYRYTYGTKTQISAQTYDFEKAKYLDQFKVMVLNWSSFNAKEFEAADEAGRRALLSASFSAFSVAESEQPEDDTPTTVTGILKKYETTANSDGDVYVFRVQLDGALYAVAADTLSTDKAKMLEGHSVTFEKRNGVLTSLLDYNNIPASASEFNGHYYQFYRGAIPWRDAENACEMLDGHLVTISSAEEQAFVESLTSLAVWIGGLRDDDFIWRWVTGEPWGYTNWNEDEPNNSANVIENENRAVLWEPRWNDLNENNIYEQNGFICEWDNTLKERTVTGVVEHFTNIIESEGDTSVDEIVIDGKTYPVKKNALSEDMAESYMDRTVFALLQNGTLTEISYYEVVEGELSTSDSRIVFVQGGENYLSEVSIGGIRFQVEDGLLTDELANRYHGKWVTAELRDDVIYSVTPIKQGEHPFTTGKDNNAFVHYWGAFSNTKDFTYRLDDEYYNRLCEISPKDATALKKSMAEKWDGSCYGIAFSMGLLFEGKIGINDLTSKSNISYYHKLDNPVADTKLYNMINYYQLSQDLSVGGKKDYITSKTYTNGLSRLLKGGDDLSTFLKNLISDIKQNHVLQLGYSYKNEGKEPGHAVLITGYRYNSAAQQYELTVYDENCINNYNQKGEELTLTVPKDYSSFDFRDSNGYPYTDKDGVFHPGYKINECYTYLYYIDYNNSDALTAKGRHAPKRTDSDQHTTLKVPVGVDFRLELSDTDWIAVTDGVWDGNISIYSVCPVENTTSTFLLLETDDYDAYRFTDMEEPISFTIQKGIDLVSVSADETAPDSIDIDFGKSVVLKGDRFDFEVFTSAGMVSPNEAGLLSVAGHSTGDVTISANEKEIRVRHDGNIPDLSLHSHIGTNRYPISTQPDADTVTIDIEKNLLHHIISLPGDVDNDGRITARDARLAFRRSVGLEHFLPDSYEYLAADIVKDGYITSADARMIIRVSVGVEPQGVHFTDEGIFRYEEETHEMHDASFRLVSEYSSGNEVTVHLFLKNCEGLQSADFELKYDPNIIRFSSTAMGSDGNSVIKLHSNGFAMQVNSEEPGVLNGSFYFNEALWDSEAFAQDAQEDDPVQINGEYFHALSFTFDLIGNPGSSVSGLFEQFGILLQIKETGGIPVRSFVCKHNPTGGVVTLPPTCIEAGILTQVCSICGDPVYDVIPPTGEHTWNNGEVIRPGNCVEARKLLYTCTVCREMKTEVIPPRGEHSDKDQDGRCDICGMLFGAGSKNTFCLKMIDQTADEITVALIANRSAGLKSADISVGYDPSILTFARFDYGADSAKLRKKNPGSFDGGVNTADSQKLGVYFYFLEYLGADPSFASDVFECVRITFRINPASSGSTDLILSVDNSSGVDMTAISPLTVTLPAAQRTLGDVNGDGKVTAADARLALRRAVGLETYAEGSAQFIACDVDKNGKVNAADARKILRASVGLENPKAW